MVFLVYGQARASTTSKSHPYNTKAADVFDVAAQVLCLQTRRQQLIAVVLSPTTRYITITMTDFEEFASFENFLAHFNTWIVIF
jgi:hypothetical protein